MKKLIQDIKELGKSKYIELKCDNCGKTFRRYYKYISEISKINSPKKHFCSIECHFVKPENHPLYGKHHSEETKRKIKEKHIGKHPSEETRKKLSEANKIRWQNPEYRNKTSLQLKAIKKTDTHKEKISKSNKVWWDNNKEQGKIRISGAITYNKFRSIARLTFFSLFKKDYLEDMLNKGYFVREVGKMFGLSYTNTYYLYKFHNIKMNVYTKERTDKIRKRMSEYQKNNPKHPLRGKPPRNFRGFGTGKYHEDIGHFTRSNWEYARCKYLKENNISYKYELQTFIFPERISVFNTTVSSYTPDILIENNGSSYYEEIKGYMPEERKERFKVQMELMKKYHPEIKIRIINKYEDLLKP